MEQNIANNSEAVKGNPFHGRLPLPSPPRPARRAPQPQLVNNPADPLPEFILQVHSELEALVNPLRGHRGEIKLRVEFGRIILKDFPRKAVSIGNSVKLHSAEELLQILEPADGGPLTFFSNVLTTLPSDTHFIMDMKDRLGQNVWNTEARPVTCRVIYEFICHRRGVLVYLPVSLEVHGDTGGGQRRIRQKREYGQINIHGTKRQWDFRIAAAGYETEENIDPLYKLLGEEISGSLYVYVNYITVHSVTDNVQARTEDPISSLQDK